MKIGSTQWVKSSYSSPEGGNCVECCPTSGMVTGAIRIRDSKTPQGPVLSFPADSFAEFVACVKAGEFSL
ncbi:DUF397 domain-containing protein [Streptomyces sp. NPDC017529]|uniref:DUF397 domain-containing protein n=1 Tax=Streptomyces sp. NPDC017529 TaxID=3365000 RepID=UPI0037A3D337